jgi:hypothetical protein
MNSRALKLYALSLIFFSTPLYATTGDPVRATQTTSGDPTSGLETELPDLTTLVADEDKDEALRTNLSAEELEKLESITSIDARAVLQHLRLIIEGKTPRQKRSLLTSKLADIYSKHKGNTETLASNAIRRGLWIVKEIELAMRGTAAIPKEEPAGVLELQNRVLEFTLRSATEYYIPTINIKDLIVPIGTDVQEAIEKAKARGVNSGTFQIPYVQFGSYSTAALMDISKSVLNARAQAALRIAILSWWMIDLTREQANTPQYAHTIKNALYDELKSAKTLFESLEDRPENDPKCIELSRNLLDKYYRAVASLPVVRAAEKAAKK